MSEGIILDSSALLALLLGEPGAERVKAAMSSNDIVMTTINLAEVVGYYARNGVAEDAIRAVLSPLAIDYVADDEELAYDIGLLLPLTREAGLSIGDRACLALARRRGATALTADRDWGAVAGKIATLVELIR